MQNQKCMYNCDICGAQFQFGPHIYDGRYIASYQITVCKSCWDGNWDGWGAGAEPKLISHLEKRGTPVPKRNEKGWLPRE